MLQSLDEEDIEKVSLKEDILAVIKAGDMAGLYHGCAQELSWELEHAYPDATNASRYRRG